jgi:hypothetical protein
MKTIQEQSKKLMSNAIGSVAGGVGAYYLAKKYGKVEKWYYLLGAAVIGAVVGANIQSSVLAKKSVPTAAEVKK